MPATTKAELQAVTAREYDKLTKLIAPIDDATALRKREEETSIKDVIGHRAHWIALFLGWYRDGQAGKNVHFPAEGYKWNDLKRYNADLRARQADLGWADARTHLAGNHAGLCALMDGLSDEDLYGAPMRGANNKWTTGRWAEAAGPSHFRSASKYIRAALREDAQPA